MGQAGIRTESTALTPFRSPHGAECMHINPSPTSVDIFYRTQICLCFKQLDIHPHSSNFLALALWLHNRPHYLRYLLFTLYVFTYSP